MQQVQTTPMERKFQKVVKGEYIWEQGKDGVKEVRCGNNGPLGS